MQLDAWRLKVPKMCSLWRFCYFSTLLRESHQISFWSLTKTCFFRQKLIYFGTEWMQIDGSGLKLTKMCSLWLFCYFFYYFALKSSRFIWPATKTCIFGKNWMIWEGMDATRWFKAKIDKMCSLWRFLVIFPVLCYRFIKGSSFCSPTKNCTFRQKLIIFG